MNKHIIPILVILLLLSSGFVGVSNNSVESVIDGKEIEQATTISSNPVNHQWPMYKHDVRHTGLSEYDTSHNPGGERWKFKFRSGIESSAAIDKDGTIYFGSYDDKLHAVYPNGTEKWNCSIGDWAQSSPAIDCNGTIYIATLFTSGKVIAVNPNGTVKWRFKPHESFSASPTIDNDGTVLIGSHEGKLYALCPNNGTLKWVFETDKNVPIRSPAIGDDGTIYINSCDTNLYALYPNGTVKWKFDTSGLFYSVPVIADDGTIYITPNCGFLYAVNPNGTEKWRAETSKNFLVTPALGPDGTIYVQCNFNTMDAFYPDGSKKWSITVTDNHDAITSTPSVGNDGTIFIGCDEHLFAINPDGVIKWKTRLTSDQSYHTCFIPTSPAIAEDGTIYIGTWFIGEDPDTGGAIDYGYLHAIGGTKIQTPEEGNLYLFGRKVWPTLFGFTIVIGKITVQVAAFQQENVENVEFLIDGQTRYSDNTPPFEWTIKERLFGGHVIQVKGYYNDGIVSTDELEVWKFF